MPQDLGTKKGLVLGIANEDSIAYGCARAYREAGADLAVTYLNPKAEPFVRPLAEALDCPIILPCDVTAPNALESVVAAVGERWGRLDFALHSIAFAPKDDLHGRLTDSSAEGFGLAMDVSVHSLVRLARLVEPLMAEGGSLVSMSYYGAEKVVENYNLMGPVKAALEAATRTLAAELGGTGIRVNALSPGPLKTRAASGIAAFDTLLAKATRKVPGHRLVTIDEVGALAAFLASDAARMISGEVIHVDGAYHAID